MELTKRKEELMAFLELNTNNNGTGIALREFLRESGTSSSFDASYMESKNSAEEEGSSAESEEPDCEGDEVMDEVKDHEDARDDEDFIVLVPPKGKKKAERKVIRPAANKQSNSKKRKCEFCGTLETPMWRRGPTGKGTLCNACGVKWSLKFRKRAGKKPTKSDRGKDEPREQRQSTRKKVPTKKSDLLFGALEVSSPPKHEEEHEHTTSLCCNHSLRRKREDEIDSERPAKRMTYLSDYDSDSGNPGLGRLLNVVEVQLVEEEQLDRVKMELQNLRTQLQTSRQKNMQQLQQAKTEVLHELADLHKEFRTVFQPQDYNAQQTAQMIRAFTSTIGNHIQEIATSISNNGNGTSKVVVENLQLQLLQFNSQLEVVFGELNAKAANDFLHMEKLLQIKEENIRNGLTSLKKDSEHDFEEMYKRFDCIDDSLERGP